MTHGLTHSTHWFLERLTRKGDTLFAYLLNNRDDDTCIAEQYLVMFCYVVSYQVIKEQCVGLAGYDHEAHIVQEVPNSRYLSLLDDCGTLGYRHFRLQTTNYVVDVIAFDAPNVQRVSEPSRPGAEAPG